MKSLFALLPAVVLVGCQTSPMSVTAQKVTKVVGKPDPKKSAALEVANAHLKTAHDLMDKGDLEEADREAKEAYLSFNEVSVEGYPLVYQFIAEIALAREKPQKALDFLKKTYARGGATATTVRLETALAYAMLGDLKQANVFYVENDLVQFVGKDDVATLPSRSSLEAMKARTYFALGMYYMGQSNEIVALRYLAKACQFAPMNPEIAYYTARANHNHGKRTKALELYRIAAKAGLHVKQSENFIYMMEQSRSKWPKEFADEKAKP